MRFKFNFIVTVVISAILISLIMGLFSFYHARSSLYERVIESELPIHISHVKNKLEGKIKLITKSAKILANNPLILNWIHRGSPKTEEINLVTLLKQITQQFNLEFVSWGDNKTHQYWGNNGFLGELAPSKTGDGLFEFIQSNQESNINISHNVDGNGYVLSTQYQNIEGRGFADLGIKLDNMINDINNMRIGNTGFIYLVDQNGKIKAHKNASLIGKQTLGSIYDEASSLALLNTKQPVLISKSDKVLASEYLADLDWFLIAEIPHDSIYGSQSSMKNMGKDVIILASILTLLSGLFAYLIACKYEKDRC